MSKVRKAKRASSRNSALKAREFIKSAFESVADEKVDDEKVEETNEENYQSEDEHFSITSESSAEEEQSDEEADFSVDEQSTSSTKNRKSSVPKVSVPKKLTPVQLERNKRKLFDLWSDFIVTPQSSLRKTSDMNFRWTINEDNQKVAICPISDCNQKFTTRQGLTYHFQRCGVNICWRCKLCDFVAEAQKTLILHHLFDKHNNSLPPTPQELTNCLKDNRKTIFKRRTKKQTLTESASAAVEFYQDNYGKYVFQNFCPRLDMWLQMSEKEASMYTPEVTISPKFKIFNPGRMENEWRQLQLFESCSSEDAFTCFVGGCVWAASWCPIPLGEIDHQYVAVATCRSSDSVHAMNCLENERGMIQLWNFGELRRKSTTDQEPRLVLGISHDYGVIWNLEWCPGGTSWQAPNSQCDKNFMPRLGLLALACGDGIVRILSVPQPRSLPATSRIYRCEPIVILDPPGIGPAFSYQSTICRCVSWQMTEEQKHIAAGFGNGAVAVWDLTTDSQILVVHKTSSQVILRPKESWIAHGAQVNDLKWLPYPNLNLIATVGFDRILKVWNLNDLITPILTIPRKSIFTKVDWNFKWCGSFSSFDDCYANWQASNYVSFKDAGFLNWPTNFLTPHRGCVWDFSISEWINAEVAVDSGGEVVMYSNFVVKHDMKTSRKAIDRLPLYRVELQELNSQSQNTKRSKKNSQKCCYNINWAVDREKPLQRSYADITNTFGIVFRDFPGTKKIPESELKKVRVADGMQYQRLSDFPLVSVTVVQWNPNMDAFNWILTAGMSGFLRISRFNLFE